MKESCGSGEVTCPGYQPWPGGSNGTKQKRLAHNDMPSDEYLQTQMVEQIKRALASFRPPSPPSDSLPSQPPSSSRAEGKIFTSKQNNKLTIHVFRRGNEYIRDWSTTMPFELGSGWTANVGDMDGDGKADIFATRIENSKLTIHVFPRRNEYIRDWSTTVPFEFGTGWTTEVGDMDGDGKADIFAF